MRLRAFVGVCTASAGLIVSAGSAVAQSKIEAGVAAEAGANRVAEWTLLADHTDAVKAMAGAVRPRVYQALTLDVAAMRDALAAAPLETAQDAWANPVYITLPNPEGGSSIFAVVESPVMEAPLQAQFPEIRTYVGQGVTEREFTVRLDMTPRGFHAQVLGGEEGGWYIDPFVRGGLEHYTAYRKSGLGARHGWACHTHDEGGDDAPAGGAGPAMIGPTLKTFRLACATTGEFTAYHGGTATLGLSAVVTAVNRVSGIFEIEAGARVVLVANNNTIVYTSPVTDPFTDPNNVALAQSQLQTRLNNVIGAANYDVGHVLHHANNGGNAGGIGVLCNAANKGKGYTSYDPPEGDAFSVDYLAHELGHQFNARHIFNNCTDGPGDDPTLAMEPGSGSTIMSYSGLCGANDLQNASLPMFHSLNFDQIQTHINGVPCGTTSATGNTNPVVSAGPDRSVPISTPFTLTPQSASDADGDALTFGWEQRDAGPALPMLAFLDNGLSPLARVFYPVAGQSRTLPRQDALLANTFLFGEILPTRARQMDWRLVARDNRAGGGGVAFDDVVLNVVGTAGPFRFTDPTSAETWPAGSTQIVRWAVNNTNIAPVNAPNVRILFSTDGGLTFPTVLAESTPNDGVHEIVVPNVTTNSARLRIEPTNNIFFNVTQGGLLIVQPPINGAQLVEALSPSFLDNAGNGNNNGRIDVGENAILVSVPVRNQGGVDATDAVGTLTSLTPTVTVTRAAVQYPVVPSLGAATTGNVPFVIAVSPSHACGAEIQLRLDMASAQGGGSFTFTLPTGRALATQGPERTFSYTGPTVPIPDATGFGATAEFPVAGLVPPIQRVEFKFDGDSCSSASGATGVGLSHTYVSQLIVLLVSPEGTMVKLIDSVGGGSGNNLCQTNFEDGGSGGAFADLVAGDAPFSGNFVPAEPMSLFNAENPNGIWQLFVLDPVEGQTGVVRSFTLTVRSPASQCQAPIAVSRCDSLDFNNDGLFPDNQDLVDFLSVFGGGACSNGVFCNDLDFNNDGLFPDNEDITSLFSVFGGGGC